MNIKLREKGFANLLLNLNNDFIKTIEKEYINNAEKYLMILNLDAEIFIKNLDKIIENNKK
jgi:hypothetical protein